jgi:hypothetical protein
MKEINLPSGNYLFVEVPDDAFDFKTIYEDKYTTLYVKLKSILDNNPFSEIETFEDWHHQECILETSRSLGIPELKIISTTKDITEEQAKGIVETLSLYGESRFKEYPHEQFPFKKVFESLQSLIQANGLDINKNYLILKKL